MSRLNLRGWERNGHTRLKKVREGSVLGQWSHVYFVVETFLIAKWRPTGQILKRLFFVCLAHYAFLLKNSQHLKIENVNGKPQVSGLFSTFPHDICWSDLRTSPHHSSPPVLLQGVPLCSFTLPAWSLWTSLRLQTLPQARGSGPSSYLYLHLRPGVACASRFSPDLQDG